MISKASGIQRGNPPNFTELVLESIEWLSSTLETTGEYSVWEEASGITRAKTNIKESAIISWNQLSLSSATNKCRIEYVCGFKYSVMGANRLVTSLDYDFDQNQ